MPLLRISEIVRNRELLQNSNDYDEEEKESDYEEEDEEEEAAVGPAVTATASMASTVSVSRQVDVEVGGGEDPPAGGHAAGGAGDGHSPPRGLLNAYFRRWCV